MHRPRPIVPTGPAATSTRERDAFTLVELLVVIGIVAVLIALLMPALRKAREQARTALCASNQRQICMAVLSYAQDNRGVLPLIQDPMWLRHQPSQAVFQPAYGLLDWQTGTLWPYVARDAATRRRLFACPSDPEPRVVTDPSRGAVVPRNFSYSLNASLGAVYGGHYGVPLAQVRATGHKVLVMEMDAPPTIAGTMNMIADHPPVIVVPLLTDRHSGFCNEGFFDGHVELIDPKIFNGTNNTTGISTTNDASLHYFDPYSSQ